MNQRARAVYGSRYHARRNAEMLERFMHGRYRARRAAFRLSRKRIESIEVGQECNMLEKTLALIADV
jgi:hypothetical protein